MNPIPERETDLFQIDREDQHNGPLERDQTIAARSTLLQEEVEGSLGASSLGNVPHRGVLIILIWLVQALAITAIPFAGNLFGLGGVMLATGVEGLTNSLGNVTFNTIIQQKFPRHLLGRIYGMFTSCQFSLHPISLALSGIVVAH